MQFILTSSAIVVASTIGFIAGFKLAMLAAVAVVDEARKDGKLVLAKK